MSDSGLPTDAVLTSASLERTLVVGRAQSDEIDAAASQSADCAGDLQTPVTGVPASLCITVTPDAFLAMIVNSATGRRDCSYGLARRSAMRSISWGAQRKPILSKAYLSVQRACSS